MVTPFQSETWELMKFRSAIPALGALSFAKNMKSAYRQVSNINHT